jgi:hypothetical protein
MRVRRAAHDQGLGGELLLAFACAIVVAGALWFLTAIFVDPETADIVGYAGLPFGASIGYSLRRRGRRWRG